MNTYPPIGCDPYTYAAHLDSVHWYAPGIGTRYLKFHFNAKEGGAPVSRPTSLPQTLNEQYFRVLRFIKANPGCTATEIQKALGGAKSPLLTRIWKLEKLGYIRRTVRKGSTAKLLWLTGLPWPVPQSSSEAQ